MPDDDLDCSAAGERRRSGNSNDQQRFVEFDKAAPVLFAHDLPADGLPFLFFEIAQEPEAGALAFATLGVACGTLPDSR